MNDWSLTKVAFKVPSGIVEENANRLDDASASAQRMESDYFVNKAIRYIVRRRYFVFYIMSTIDADPIPVATESRLYNNLGLFDSEAPQISDFLENLCLRKTCAFPPCLQPSPFLSH